MVVSPGIIPTEEQTCLADSYVDPNGRVFEWRGEIYRSLEANYARLWFDLHARGLISDLVRDGLLVESEPTQLKTESGRVVVRHRKIPVVSFCYEWLPEMLKAAALLKLDLCIRLANLGLTLQDGHPWNILFEGTHPIYVDASSIVPVRNDILWAPYQQFCNFFLFPLYLYAAGCERAACWLLRDYLAGVTDADLLKGLPLRFKLRHPRRFLGVAVPRLAGRVFGRLPEDLQQRFFALSKIANSGPAGAKYRLKFFESLQKDIAGLKFTNGSGFWANYYNSTDKGYFHTHLAPGDWQRKQEVVGKILTDLRPRSVLDVGANTGIYSKMAAKIGSRVTACETDISALARCYEDARRERLDILPLTVNVFSTSPTPGRGGIPCLPPTERFQSELVMGLAVVHHIVALQRIPISRISEILSTLTSRCLLLEYVPSLQPKIGGSPVPSLDDFTADGFELCLKSHFKAVRSFPSYPEPRRLFLCEK